MSAVPKTRNRFFLRVFPLIVLAGAGAVYFSAWHGLDTIVSRVLSRSLGVSARVSGVGWDSLYQLHFSKLLIQGPEGDAWIRTGPGSLRWLYVNGSASRGQVFFSEGVVQPSLISGFVGKAAALPRPLLSREFFIESAAVEFHKSGRVLELWIHSLRSDDLQAQGGFRWNGRELSVAHVMLKVSSSLLKDVPGDWLRRFPVNDHDQRMIKCSFRDRQLTLFGRSGPMLRASWDIAYTTSP